jgi:agmatinase
MSDYENDGYCGFEIVEAREIDSIGTEGIIKKIHDRVGHENPVYLSIDIDTLDLVSSAPSSVDWKVSNWWQPISLKSLLLTTPMPSLPPWPLLTFCTK